MKHLLQTEKEVRGGKISVGAAASFDSARKIILLLGVRSTASVVLLRTTSRARHVIRGQKKKRGEGVLISNAPL